MRNILLTSVVLLGFAAPAFAGQDSGNAGANSQGPFVTASQDSGNTGLSNQGRFTTASQDSGNTGLSNGSPFTSAQYDSHWDLTTHGALASQDSGNLPDTLRNA